MKRAILVTSGTLAGLAAVLTYSGADQVPAMASGPSDAAALGAPPAIDDTPSDQPSASPSSPSGAASTPAAAASSAAPAPTKAAAAPTKAAAAPTKAAAAPTKAAAAPTPAPTKAAAPKPTPTPTPKATATGPKDYLGPVITHKYGKVQVGIRVQGGKITAAWAAVYPTGDSQPYTDFSIPVLKSQTVKAQSANIAGASGATETTNAWKKSLQGALSKAGI